MRTLLLLILSAGFSAAALADEAAPDRAKTPTLAVLDIELTGDLGGPEFAAEHAKRLNVQSDFLRQRVRETQRYQIVELGPAAKLIEDLKSQQTYLHDCNGCDLDIGRQLGAQQVMVTWVTRVSGLILTLTYEIHDVATRQIVMRKSYDFRGDNDNAWSHAIKYMVRDMTQGSA